VTLMRKGIAVIVAVVTPLAVVATALATTSSVVVTTFVRATLHGNKAHDGIISSCARSPSSRSSP
jgi:hypothetical protein